MYSFVCPGCKKVSYSADEFSFHPCPYCGLRFSGRYGPEKREEERHSQEISFMFPYRGQHFKANTINLSEKGLSVYISGTPPVMEGDTLNIPLGDMQIKAKIVWLVMTQNRAMAGLQRLN